MLCEIQSLIGLLNFTCSVVFPVRAFLWRRLNLPFSDRAVQGNIPWNGRIPNTSSREPSAQELVAQLNELLNSSLTSGSQKAYQRAWTCYRQFHARFYSACDTQLIPVSIDALALFISYLSCKKFAVATIHSYVSAIGYVHRLRGIGDPTKSFTIQKLLTATSRNRVSDIQLPISRPLLHQLVSSLCSTNSSVAQRK